MADTENVEIMMVLVVLFSFLYVGWKALRTMWCLSVDAGVASRSRMKTN